MIEDIKICGGCKILKSLDNFNNCKTGRMGKHNHCKECQKIFRRRRYLKFQKEEKLKSSDPKTREKAKEQTRKKYKENLEFREKCLKKHSNYAKSDRGRHMSRLRSQKRLLDPSERIASNIRTRIRLELKGGAKYSKSEDLLGISFEKFKEYIESLFSEGMSWENYGQWHIDHIIPCNFFDLTLEEHQKICFNYKNQQPLWERDNLSKGCKILITDPHAFIEDIQRNFKKGEDDQLYQ